MPDRDNLMHSPDDLILSYDLGGLEATVVRCVTLWPTGQGVDDLREGLRCVETLCEQAAELRQTRRLGLFDVILDASQYVSDNKLNGHETEAVLAITRWHRTLDVRYLQMTRMAIVELIHAENMRESAALND